MSEQPLPLETDVTIVASMREGQQPFLLLDVREEDEYAVARIEGSRLIPMSQLGDRLDELNDYRNEPIVVHCHHGIRSLNVTHALRNRGFAKSQSMAGGIDRWSLVVDPSVPRY
jgi:rhodanese-related sulfurtransferase